MWGDTDGGLVELHGTYFFGGKIVFSSGFTQLCLASTDFEDVDKI